MHTLSINRILVRWLISLSGVGLGVITAAVFLLWVGNSPRSAQAADSPLPRGEGLGVRVSADWWAAVKDQLAQDRSIGLASLTPSPVLTLTGEATGSNFGYSVATAGDVNGDGYSDAIAGAYGYDSIKGRVYLYYGSANGLSTTPVFTATGEASDHRFGVSVGTAGDVNGAGYADISIGADGYPSGIGLGRVYVYTGTASGLSDTPAFTATGEAGANYFGSVVGPAGDVNGDGYSDIIIGAQGFNSYQGRVYVYTGTASGLSNTPAFTATGQTVNDNFGISVGTAGDVNGDGYADIVIGAYRYNNNTGRAYVYTGTASGLSATPALTITGEMTDDFFGRSVGAAGDVNGDGYADIVVGALGYSGGTGRAYVYMGSGIGLSVTPAFTATGEALGDGFGISVGTAGDVNGDSYADVIIGKTSAGGRVYIYQGSLNGLSDTPDFTHSMGTDFFGWSATTAGDVNGDGYADIIVGAYGSNGFLGQAYVYHGAADLPGSTATFTANGEAANNRFGFSVASAGDVNGDGYADAIVGADLYGSNTGRAYLYLGSATGLSTTLALTATGEAPNDQFGISVGTAGDVNGDGYADVIIGTHGPDHAYIFLGTVSGLSATPAFTLTGESPSVFGFAAGTAGDVNGDGYSDIIIGAHTYSNTGRVYVYLGSATALSSTPTFTATGEATGNDTFGFSVGTAGDVNRDGYADVIIGAPGYLNNTGRAYVYLGSANGLKASPAFTTTGELEGDLFGISAETAGDVDRDGYSDIVVGAYGYPGGYPAVGPPACSSGCQGRAYVYLGGAGGLSSAPAFTVTGEPTNNRFGASVGTAGDVNGDGYADIVIGAWGYLTQTGQAYVYLGSATGLEATPTITVMGETTGTFFGKSVGSAGDVNGDGYADIIVGAERFNNSTGRAYLYPGNGSYGLSLVPQQRRADDSAPIAHGGQSDSATSFRLAALGRSPFGRGKVKLEWEVKPLGTPFDGTGTQQSANWLDSGTAGAAFNELVTGLSANTLYHWRVRVRYHPASKPFQQYSRWFTQPWNGWQEADLRTAAGPTPPPIKLYLPFIAR